MDNNFSDPHEYCQGDFDPEDIVVTGMAGRFPECNSVKELLEGLMSKKNLIVYTDTRFEKGACKSPLSSGGLIPNLEKFDADYFRLPHPTVNAMDPGTRKVLEISYEAIFDSGYDPTSLKGSNIGVYNATTNDDAQHLNLHKEQKLSGFSWLRCLNSNRVSYGFDFIGPSFSIDTACSSSAVATWAAINDMREGRTEAAIVNACQLDLNPAISMTYMKHGISSSTGNSVPFDANTDGIIRTEAVAAIFLQKAKHARRAYAKICSTKFVTSGFVPEGVSVPSLSMQIKVSESILADAGLSPDDIDYFEAHGTGTTVGDPIELNSISKVYCEKKRKKPLYIGSIKSNIGHTEAVSGLCGIIKAILSLETGMIPPNYKYSTPNPNCQALVDGKIQVVTQPVALQSPYIPVNSFGLAGTIVQVLLKQNTDSFSNTPSIKSKLPRFVLYNATSESAIKYVFDYIRDHPELPEQFFALFNKLSFCSISLKPLRGYSFYQDHQNPVSEIKLCTSDSRQIWFVYTGMGCQWRGMGLQLMEIDIFANAMKRCAAILKPFGLDIFEILKPESDSLEQDRKINNALCGIAAIQIAMTDVLTALGIQPDGIIGHSTGEVMAAYADGCTTLEQTILSAYYRGVAIETNMKERGAMAAVGLTWEEAKRRCPKNVYAACHNADDSVTISGLEEDVDKFVATLKKENIFAKIVNAYGYSFHCKYTQSAAPYLLTKLTSVLQDQKPRTSRWITTSFIESDWHLEKCKYAGPDYFTNNLVSSVYFNEAMQKIPPNAVTIEIGPHFLLQSIMKRGLGSESSNFGLMKRNNPNNLKFFFEQIGKLYLEGLDPKIENIYPSVKFPVPRGTPFLSDLLQWNYSSNFSVPKWEPVTGETSRTFYLEKEDIYLMDHFIDGRSLFPATGYIFVAWEMFANKRMKTFTEMPILIENFKIHRATVITQQSIVTFNFNILSDSGHFQITEGHSVVASGQIFEWKNGSFSEPEPSYIGNNSVVVGADVYNELKMAGYEYKPAFQQLMEINMDGTQGLVTWQDKWIPFLDSLLLFFGLITNSSDFQLPTGALSFKIDPTVLLERIKKSDNTSSQGLPVKYNPNTKICRSVGIEITKLQTDPAPHRVKEICPTLEEYKFIPYICNYTPDSSLELELLRYMWACNKVLDMIGQKLKKDVISYKFCVGSDSGISFEKYIETITENHSLLKCLQQIAENPSDVKNGKKDFFETFNKTAGRDILNCVMVNEYPLRIMLEILTENNFRKLNILEVNKSGFTVVLPAIIDIVKKYSHLKFKNSILISSENVEVNVEELRESNIQQKSLDALETLANEKDQDVVIGSYMGGSLNELRENINTLSSVVKSTGFVLFYCKEKLLPAEKFMLNLYGEDNQIQSRNAVEKIFQENNLIVLSKIFDSLSAAVYLLRPSPPVLPYKILKVSDDNEYAWVEQLKNLLANADDTVWLIAEDSSTNGIIGMINCLKQEPGGERVKCVFISTKDDESKPPAFSFELPFYRSLLGRNLIMNVWRDGAWGSFRHVLLNNHKELKSVEHSYVNCRKYGDLSSFEWLESHVKYAARVNEKLVHIYYAALNFKDVMLATGKLSIGTTKSITGQGDDSVLGLEFSGRDESGRRVAGVVSSRGMATSTLVDPALLIDVPDDWSLEEAATVPVVYCTSYYAIIMRAKLQKGEKILIHSGTGGIGIAAINIALSLGCEVFATVGNDDKKKFLRTLFPEIKEENIGCSRNTSFENMIMERTNGKGVDVVLNSLADEKFLASVRCVGKHGRFIEIGKYDLSLNRNLGLRVFLENITFHGVFLDQLFERNAYNIKVFSDIMQLMRDGIKTGVVKPLDRTLFRRDEVEEAFRYMAKGIHVGKVVLKIRDEESEKRAIPKTLVLPAVPNTYFYTNKVYIIIGGLGGFGIEVTKWILNRGGKNVILTTRYGARTPYQQLCLRRWEKEGANVMVLTLNAADRQDAEELLKKASKVGPVGGIFNSAVVLKDAFIDQQSSIAYDEVCAPKAYATKYLDELSRKQCPLLDYFVCFSSISCGRGNAGQTNYGYANSVMERICEQRKSKGLHGLAVQWGIIGDVGVVHRHMGDDAMIAGVSAQNVKSCLESLDLFCQTNHAVVSSYMAAVAGKKGEQQDFLSQIVKILGLSDGLNEVMCSRSLGEMGIDSLLGVEIRQLLESHFDIVLSMQELFEMKIGDLQELASKASEKEANTNKSPSLVNTVQIKLPTMSNKEVVVQLNKHTSGFPIFIVNVGDTDISEFTLLAQRVDAPIYSLQWTKSINAKTVEELATYYLEIIEQKVASSFHIIGFALGGSVAFEMARQVKTQRLKSLVLLDGSATLLKAVNKEVDSRDPEVSAILSFVEQFSSEASPKLESELLKAKSLDQRIKIVLNFLTSTSSETVNNSEMSEGISQYINKANIINSYVPKNKLQMDIIDIEDPVKVLPNDVTELKATFSQVVFGKVAVHRALSQKDLTNKESVNRLYSIMEKEIFSKNIF